MNKAKLLLVLIFIVWQGIVPLLFHYSDDEESIGYKVTGLIITVPFLTLMAKWFLDLYIYFVR